MKGWNRRYAKNTKTLTNKLTKLKSKKYFENIINEVLHAKQFSTQGKPKSPLNTKTRTKYTYKSFNSISKITNGVILSIVIKKFDKNHICRRTFLNPFGTKYQALRLTEIIILHLNNCTITRHIQSTWRCGTQDSFPKCQFSILAQIQKTNTQPHKQNFLNIQKTNITFHTLVPQGVILSPSLCHIYTANIPSFKNNISSFKKNPNIDLLICANDIASVTHSKNSSKSRWTNSHQRTEKPKYKFDPET